MDNEFESVFPDNICESMQLQPIQPGSIKTEVLSALKSSLIFHFAGHGGTNPKSPLHSQLLLRDYIEDPLTVENLLKTNIGSASPFLAYLSACGTGENRNADLADEGIYLTIACQIAGFRHVIGILWSVDDSMYVKMAEAVYKVLHDEAIDSGRIRDQAVSGALHHAMRKLRDQWVGEANSSKSGEHQRLTRLGRDA
ncbi:CHAT domain-containing protein [Xylariaceae sp. FL0255]|nr:CHAT domain-containing protein [Xylariaceae sp. FL0255]